LSQIAEYTVLDARVDINSVPVAYDG